MTDSSVLVDRYVKDYIAMWSIQFSPNGQLLATVATDGQIRVRVSKSESLSISYPLSSWLDMGYHHETNASDV